MKNEDAVTLWSAYLAEVVAMTAELVQLWGHGWSTYCSVGPVAGRVRDGQECPDKEWLGMSRNQKHMTLIDCE